MHAPRTWPVVLLLAAASPAWARTPPVAVDAKEGLWLGAGERFVHQTRDRFSVFEAGATVNGLAVDGATVWIATDDGAIRLDSGSRGVSRLGMDDGFPSQSVTSVAVDDRFVWFGTNKGLVRYRKLDRTLRVFGEEDGLPHRAVNHLLAIGRKVWVATRGGLALYDPDVDGLRAFTSAEGLGAEDVVELFLVGDDLWCRTDQGLSRLRVKARAFTNFTFADIGAEELRTFVPDGERVWVGTEKGLFGLELATDAFVPFEQQAVLESPRIVGVEPASDFLFITTEKEVVQVQKVNRSVRRFTAADGLARSEGALGTAFSGGVLTVLFADGAELLDMQRELWSSRSLEVTEDEKATTARVFGRVNAEVPVDLRERRLEDERFATAELGFGFAHRIQDRRTLDVSARLDYGQLELPGIRDLEARVDYQGNETDGLRELRLEDRMSYRTLEEGLDAPLLLLGGQTRLATEGKSPKGQLTVATGLRRGATARDFLTGSRKEIHSLSHRYVLPGSERVYVDGELLTNGTDYTLIYPAGQLAFLDRERVDELSVIEVEYEYDLIPRKGLGVMSLLDLLPADREVGDWTRSGEARMISEESGLYAQIDGAAPKYLDRGWVKSVYAEYRQGGRSIQVAIHDLGSEANARSLYDFDLPPAREQVPEREDLVIDLGLASAYAAKALTGTFYLELSIDEKSDAAKQSLKLFALQMLGRGEGAGENLASAGAEWLASTRAAASPLPGLELGGRVVELYGVGAPDGPPARRFLTSIADARWERAVGEGGQLTAYGEVAGTYGQQPGSQAGWGALSRVRLAHPSIEGSVSLRHHSPTYAPLGSDAALFGKLGQEARASATAYPTRWLPTSVFLMRQSSMTEAGEPGLVQHALTRVQLARDGLPTASLQLGHSLLAGPGVASGRVKGVAQAEYDLAQRALAFTGIKRLSLRGLYSVSQEGADEGGGAVRQNRVQLSRLEARFAPTATESAYALFRSGTVSRQPAFGDVFSVAARRWELNSGVRSAIIPGLIPQANYSVLFEDEREAETGAFRGVKGVASAALGILPGQWRASLTPLLIEPRLSLSTDERAEGALRVKARRTERLDTRAAWAGTGKIELELYELYEVGREGPERVEQTKRLELRHRFVYRPVHASPITLRLNYARQDARNDTEALPDAPAWGSQSTYEGGLEWLMRWNPVFTTRVRGTYSTARIAGWVQVDPSTQQGSLQSYVQNRAGAEAEVRVLLPGTSSRLFLLQRDRVYQLFGQGPWATGAIGYDVAGGIIWSLGDKLYLDSEVAFRQSFCRSGPCAPTRALEPRVLLTCDL